jgi:hypothetical protein
LNTNYGRLVVFHKAGLKTIWQGQRSNRRLRQGDGFANPREEEKSGPENDRAPPARYVEGARRPAHNLNAFPLHTLDFITRSHKEVTYSHLRAAAIWNGSQPRQIVG